MKRLAIVLAAIIVILVASFYTLNNYIYDAKQADLSAYSYGTYAYRCQDGTEFTMSPAQDMSSIRLVPATDAERIPEAIISKVAGTNARYEGNGIFFAGNGETVILGNEDFQTSCTPVANPDEAPFNFGDAEEAQNEAWTPERRTLTGEYVCLPHVDTAGPQTMECAFGLKADDGTYYALDFALMSQESPKLTTGDRFTANGILTPIEQLSTDHWKKYNIQGIFSVTDLVDKL